MQTVEIDIPAAELKQQMAAMRSWLDEHRFEPSAFACDDARPGIRVSVTFSTSVAAEAFASRFSGRLHAHGAALETQILLQHDLVG
jgi:hypothetical protein